MIDSDKEGYNIDYYVNNPYKEPMTILCDTLEFNRMKVLPRHTVRIPMFVPKGLKPWTKESISKGRRVTWVGLLDIDAPNI